MKKSSPKNLPLPVLHLLAWAAYGCYAYAMTRVTNPYINVPGVIGFLLPYACIFYLSLASLKLMANNKVIKGLALYLSTFAAILYLGYFYVYHLLPAIGIIIYASTDLEMYVHSVVFGYVQYTCYALIYFFVVKTVTKTKQIAILEKQMLEKELENMRHEQEKLQYEYAFLRAQINPHFLLNTLNALFAQAMGYSEALAKNIQKLASVMQYALETQPLKHLLVPLKDELKHVTLLLQIYQVRFGEQFYLRYECEGSEEGHQVPPLSFLTIVENAFKYGQLKDASDPLSIQVKASSEQLCFHCRNRKKRAVKDVPSSGIGLDNLKRRLDAVLKGRYSIDLNVTDTHYAVELIIKN